jgi:hypothetical protein
MTWRSFKIVTSSGASAGTRDTRVAQAQLLGLRCLENRERRPGRVPSTLYLMET